MPIQPKHLSAVLTAAQKLRPAVGASIARSLLPIGVILLVAAAMQWAIGPACGDFAVNVMSKVGIFIMLAASLNLVNGYTGQFSIGHAGFLAVGGYTAAWITTYGSMWLLGSSLKVDGFFNSGVALFLGGCLAGGGVAAALGYFVGLPSLRLKGDYLAIVTLGFGEIVRVLLTRTGDVFLSVDELQAASLGKTMLAVGGALGFSGVPWYNTLFWTVLLAGLILLVCYRVKQSSTGRAFLSIREDEIAAQAMGINVTKMKVRAFVLSSGLAGIAGGVFAHQPGNSLVPSELNFQFSFDVLIMVVLGGLGSISGAVLAAIGVTVLTEVLKDPPSALPWGAALTAGVLALTLLRRDIRPVSALRSGARIIIVGVIITGLLETLRLVAIRYGVNLADYRMIIYALVLILVMIFRPQGLLGIHELWDIRKLFRETALAKRSSAIQSGAEGGSSR